MAIENRDLEPGTRLIATYKKQRVGAVTVEDGVKLTEVGQGFGVFDLDTVYRSLSAAGSALTGSACNGWRFWSLEADAPAAPAPKAKSKSGKLIRRTPNQQALKEGQVRWFCNACMASFVLDGEDEPDACPQGHGVTDPEFSLYDGDTPAAVEAEAVEV